MERFLISENNQSSDPQPRMTYFIKDVCSEPLEVVYQTHYVAEFIYIINGSGIADINGVRRKLSARDFYIINPYKTHGECITKGERFYYYIIGVKNFFMPQKTDNEFELLKTLSPGDNIVFLLNKIYEEQTKQKPDYQKATENYFSLLVTEIERKFSGKSVFLPVLNDDLAGAARTIIEESFAGNISGKMIAGILNVKINTLERRFKKATGKSMQQYILERRILCARETLERNNVSTMQLASFTGFDNSAYFCKYFKKITGMTPKQYQKEFMKKEKW